MIALPRAFPLLACLVSSDSSSLRAFTLAPEWAEALPPAPNLRSDWTPPVRRAWAMAVLVLGRACGVGERG